MGEPANDCVGSQLQHPWPLGGLEWRPVGGSYLGALSWDALAQKGPLWGRACWAGGAGSHDPGAKGTSGTIQWTVCHGLSGGVGRKSANCCLALATCALHSKVHWAAGPKS